MDFPGQYNLRKLVVQKLINPGNITIPAEITHIVPILGPLHVSLNIKETCLKTFHPFFNDLYKHVFQKKHNLPEKPQPYKIDLLLYIAHGGWKLIRKEVADLFKNTKNPGFCSIIDLLDNFVPAALEVYPIIFKNQYFDEYVNTIFRLWMYMSKCNRKNYNKIMLAFISDVMYWKHIHHPILNLFQCNLNSVDEYLVENFHSLIRRNSGSKITTPERLRKYAIFIDHDKHDDVLKDFIKKTNCEYKKFEMSNLVKKTSMIFLKSSGFNKMNLELLLKKENIE